METLISTPESSEIQKGTLEILRWPSYGPHEHSGGSRAVLLTAATSCFVWAAKSEAVRSIIPLHCIDEKVHQLCPGKPRQ